MRHPIRRLAATAVATLAIGIGLSACGGGDPSSAGAPGTGAATTAAPAPATGPTPAAPGGAGEPGGPGSSGAGSSGSGPGGDGPGQPPTGRPPRIMAPSVEPYLSEGELVADVLGHAYDDDGPDPQLRVARVEIQWGDGTTTAAELGGHGVFRDFHEYDPSYRGRTVTVRIVAYGHDGQATTETRAVPLPS